MVTKVFHSAGIRHGILKKSTKNDYQFLLFYIVYACATNWLRRNIHFKEQPHIGWWDENNHYTLKRYRQCFHHALLAQHIPLLVRIWFAETVLDERCEEDRKLLLEFRNRQGGHGDYVKVHPLGFRIGPTSPLPVCQGTKTEAMMTFWCMNCFC